MTYSRYTLTYLHMSILVSFCFFVKFFSYNVIKVNSKQMECFIRSFVRYLLMMSNKILRCRSFYCLIHYVKSDHIQSEWGKIRTSKTLNTDTFHTVILTHYYFIRPVCISVWVGESWIVFSVPYAIFQIYDSAVNILLTDLLKLTDVQISL